MKNPKIIYVLISLFCIFAIIAGIYAQFIDADYGGLNVSKEEEFNTIQSKSNEEIEAQFNNLFTNTLNLGNFDTTGIQKINQEENIVYSIYNKKEQTDNYEINIHIPVININSELSNSLNQITQANFVNKANEIITRENSSVKTIYSIDYTAYVNNDILSLVIKSTLKEGDSPQRVIVITYNYNLNTDTQASLIDLITIKELNRDEVNTKIKQVCSEANEEAIALQNMGYNSIFVRDMESEIYNIDNAGAYFLGPNKELYIIYAYGNNEFTSEMDVILFE